jgi:hypothetical protein
MLYWQPTKKPRGTNTLSRNDNDGRVPPQMYLLSAGLAAQHLWPEREVPRPLAAAPPISQTARSVPVVAEVVRLHARWLLDTSAIGNQPVEQTRHATSVSCSFTPFYDHNVLLPNGGVVICCGDYSVKRKIGNLIEGDYFSLFSSRGMAELHSENTKPGYSDKTICKSRNSAIRYEIAPDQGQYWRASRG